MPSSNHSESGNRRRRTPTISPRTGLRPPRGKASAGQHRLPGDSYSEVESKTFRSGDIVGWRWGNAIQWPISISVQYGIRKDLALTYLRYTMGLKGGCRWWKRLMVFEPDMSDRVRVRLSRVISADRPTRPSDATPRGCEKTRRGGAGAVLARFWAFFRVF